MIQFEKVSFEQFEKDYIALYGESPAIRDIYDRIKLPERSTSGAAGYDFFSHSRYCVLGQNTCHILTGIRVKMPKNVVFLILPRSSIGIKKGVGLANTIGVIDSDYYYADNEGHIHIVLRNYGPNNAHIDIGDKFAQGMFVPYYLADGDETQTVRTGGLGSTGE